MWLQPGIDSKRVMSVQHCKGALVASITAPHLGVDVVQTVRKCSACLISFPCSLLDERRMSGNAAPIRGGIVCVRRNRKLQQVISRKAPCLIRKLDRLLTLTAANPDTAKDCVAPHNLCVGALFFFNHQANSSFAMLQVHKDRLGALAADQGSGYALYAAVDVPYPDAVSYGDPAQFRMTGSVVRITAGARRCVHITSTIKYLSDKWLTTVMLLPLEACQSCRRRLSAVDKLGSMLATGFMWVMRHSCRLSASRSGQAACASTRLAIDSSSV